MARGKFITQEEVNKAHELKQAGKPLKVIGTELGRSMPTVYKMLAQQPKEEETNEHP